MKLRDAIVKGQAVNRSVVPHVYVEVVRTDGPEAASNYLVFVVDDATEQRIYRYAAATLFDIYLYLRQRTNLDPTHLLDPDQWE